MAYTIESLFSSLIDEARGREAYTYKGSYYTNIMMLKYNKHYKLYKNRPFKGKYCQYYKLTSYSTTSYQLLFPNLAFKDQTLSSKRSKKTIKSLISTIKKLFRAKILNLNNKISPKAFSKYKI